MDDSTPRYIYKTVSTDAQHCWVTHHNSTVDEIKLSLAELLTDLGREGWEVVHVGAEGVFVLLRKEEE